MELSAQLAADAEDRALIHRPIYSANASRSSFQLKKHSFSNVMSQAITELPPTDVRTVDRELLDALRSGEAFGISELTELLGVTATAVRQRLERMLESGLVERTKVVAGRGRPTFTYQLTLLGHRRAGADHADLADAMWHEILALPDTQVRNELLARIARRLGAKYRQQATRMTGDDSLASRMRSLTQVLAGHRIPADVSTAGNLPIIGFSVCPHPDLASESERKAMCRLEEQMLSEALGSEIHLKSCRLDGDQCCQFAPTNYDGEHSEATDGDASKREASSQFPT